MNRATRKEELAGGVSSALLSMPGNLAVGLIVFSLLGPDFEAQALAAGFICSIVAGACALAGSGLRGMITGPGALSAIVLASGLEQYQKTAGSMGWTMSPEHLFLAAFATVFLAGAAQCGFGLLRLGRIIRYTPHPVLVGLLTGAGAVIVLSQSELIMQTGSHPLVLAVTAVSAAAMLWGGRIIPKTPSPLLALLAGCALYYSLQALGFGQHIGARLEPLRAEMAIASVSLDSLQELLTAFVSSQPMLENVLSSAASLAMFATLSSLIAIAGVERVLDARANVDREIALQGVANMAMGLLGGAPAEANLGRTKVNHAAGGRGGFSQLAHMAVFAVVLFLAPQATSVLPRPVLNGMIIALGVTLLDPWIFSSLRRLAASRCANRELLVNLGVALLVVAVSIWANLIIAVMAGAGLSILLYVRESSSRSVRGVISGARYRSNRQRDRSAMRILTAHGKDIQLVELEGGLFFGSVETIREHVEKLLRHKVRHVILDFKRVAYMDLSASVGLHGVIAKLLAQGVDVGLSRIPSDSELHRMLCSPDCKQTLAGAQLYQNAKQAMEDMEDRLLHRYAGESREDADLNKALGLDGVPPEECVMLVDYLARETWQAGDRVIGQGDKADAVYFVAEGVASLHLPPAAARMAGEEGGVHLASFGKGAFFGEYSFFGESTHGVEVRAKTDLVTYRLARNNYETLSANHPELAQALLASINMSLTRRLRTAFLSIAELEEKT